MWNPSFPYKMKYDENMTCKFQITAPRHHVIHIDIEKISAQKLLINNETMNSPEIGRLSYVGNVEIFINYEKMIRYGDLKIKISSKETPCSYHNGTGFKIVKNEIRKSLFGSHLETELKI